MNLSPKQIVEELNKYIIGQDEAKKAVAIALRNRYRRSMLSAEEMAEITPKNIIMKGPTGVGKTEIARRLAKLVGAPFVKVEATKYTEVGYVGRDVESMIRDLEEFYKVIIELKPDLYILPDTLMDKDKSYQSIAQEINEEDSLKDELLSVEKNNKPIRHLGMKKSIILVCVAILLIASLIAGYVLFGNNDNDEEDKNFIGPKKPAGR